MNKIYCKNCKYALYGNSGSYCSAKYQTESDKYTGERELPYQRKMLNKTGECLEYKRIWWKFWLK